MNTETKMTIASLNETIVAMQLVIDQLSSDVNALKNPIATPSTSKEMTDDDARRIMTGDHAATKHKEAAAALGLSYGQVYSCRGEYTFKHIHKELKADPAYKNSWTK